MKSISDEIRNILDNSNIFFEIWSIDNDNCEVYIDRGDWKHEHRRLMNLLDRAGYDYEKEITDEDDGDDCYSAKYIVSRNIEYAL